MKIIVLLDWSDDQSEMPAKPGYTQEALDYSRYVMTTFESWRQKQVRPEQYQLVLWHTHFFRRFIPPSLPEGRPLPMDCEANADLKRVEAIVKNYNACEPIVVADPSFEFHDDLVLEPFLEQAMQPDSSIVMADNAWVVGPSMQRHFVEQNADYIDQQYEKDWTEADFCDWVERTTWTFAKTYAKTSPHEYAVLGKPNTELHDLYRATMFILRNGFVQMYYRTPFMAYEVGNRRYWSYFSYGLINRSLEGDLTTYQ